MSVPPRPSISLRNISQPDPHLSTPTILPQYPPSSNLPPPNRSNSYPQAVPRNDQYGYPTIGQMNGRTATGDTHRYFRTPNRDDQYEPKQRSDSKHDPSTPSQRVEESGPSDTKLNPKKRIRNSSISMHPSQSPASPKVDTHPNVLVREKKPKACASCRRAKLKCIVEEGNTDCLRCKFRKQRCIFYPRSHVRSFPAPFSSS